MMSWNLTVLKRTRKFNFTNLVGPVIGAVAGAHLIIIFGVEVSFFEAILNPKYYKAMAGSFPIAFLLIHYVGYTSEKLDRHWSWINHFLHRALAQFIFGILLTGLAAFLLAFLYFQIRGLHILDTLYLRVDFPVVLLLILLVNMFYVLLHFYGKLKVNHVATNESSSAIAMSEEDNEIVSSHAKETIMVSKGSSSIPIPVMKISFCYLANEYRYLQTTDGTNYLVTQTLDEIERQLDSKQFFRVNRQVIVNFNSCTHYTTIEYGKLEVFTQPVFKERIVVSQRKAKEFREWMDR